MPKTFKNVCGWFSCNSFRSKDDALETDEFKNFFLRSLGESATSACCCLFIASPAGSTFRVRVGIFGDPSVLFRILDRINSTVFGLTGRDEGHFCFKCEQTPLVIYKMCSFGSMLQCSVCMTVNAYTWIALSISSNSRFFLHFWTYTVHYDLLWLFNTAVLVYIVLLCKCELLFSDSECKTCMLTLFGMI